jgi:hypothetical protein
MFRITAYGRGNLGNVALIERKRRIGMPKIGTFMNKRNARGYGRYSDTITLGRRRMNSGCWLA